MWPLSVARCHSFQNVRIVDRPPSGKGNDLVERAHERYPDLIVPMAMIEIDRTEPTLISDLADRGFRGLKIIGPRRNYDDPAYFPLYQVDLHFHPNASSR